MRAPIAAGLALAAFGPRRVRRLGFVALSTTQIGWDQPHEGNLFEHLYARRAFQHAVAV